ncbi:MAG TPA: hypothetical protein VGH99_02055 [Pseudonocardia sp.]|jgi:hypothetical protein
MSQSNIDARRAGGMRPASEPGLADPTAARTVRPHLLRAGMFAVVIAVFVLVWAFGISMSTMTAMQSMGVHTVDLGPEVATALTVIGLGGMIIFGIIFLFMMFVPVREFVDEWGTLLGGAAGRLEPVSDAVRAAVAQRCPPFTSEVESGHGRVLVQVGNDREWAVVIVREVGPDLHLGWTMWRNRSTVALLAGLLGSSVEGKSVDDPRLLQAGWSSALRETLYAATEPHGHTA